MKTQFGVAAIAIKTGEVIWINGPYDADNAEAVIRMAIARQGVEDRFFSACHPDQYKPGDKWEGGSILPSPETSSDGSLVRHGNTWYPNGPRGL